MALDPNEQYSSVNLAAQLQIHDPRTAPVDFAQGSGDIEVLQPIAFNTALGFFVPWAPPVNEVSRITANATPASDGTFTITVDGETTATIDHDASAATILSRLEALSNIEPGDVSVVAAGGGLGTGSGTMTITFAGKFTGRVVVVSIATGGLTGNAHVLSEVTAGVESNGAHLVKGFAFEEFSLIADAEQVKVIYTGGELRFSDIPVPAGATSAQLLSALKASELLKRDFRIQGAAGYYSQP